MAKGRFQVAQFLGEAIGQPVQPLHKQPLRAVEPLDVRRAYRPCLPTAYSPYAGPLGADHFGRGVDHRGVAVLLDDRAELDVGAESQVNRFGIGREASVEICTIGGYPPILNEWASLACGFGNINRPAMSIMNRRALSADRLPIRKPGISLVFWSMQVQK